MSGISAENKILKGTGADGTVMTGQDVQKAFSASDDKSFAALFSDIIKERAAIQLSAAMSGDSISGGSSFGLPASTATDTDPINSLMLSLAGGGELDSESAMMMLFSLMSSDSGADISLISSLLGSSSASDAYRTAYRTNTTVGNTADTTANTDILTALALGASASSREASFGAPGTIPQNAWVAVTPAITGDESCRSAELTNEIIGQFEVETNKRYTPYKYGSDTYCNIFVWDVTSAMGAEIPHYVDAKTGEPRYYPDVTGAMELDANGVYDWLSKNGKKYGWIEVGAADAQVYANKGYPAVSAWKNSGGRAGHVQVVCPSKSGNYDEIRGVTVAQSGRNNQEYAYISSTMSAGMLPEVRYFIHA